MCMGGGSDPTYVAVEPPEIDEIEYEIAETNVGDTKAVKKKKKQQQENTTVQRSDDYLI